MSSLTLRRIALTLIPLGLLAAVFIMAVMGESGLVRRHELRQELYRVNEHAQSLRKETSEMRRELKVLQQKDIGLRRLAATELRMGPPGSTIYVFQDEVQ